MKEEVEFKHLCRLYNKEGMFKNEFGSFIDFENVCEIPLKNREFRVWLKEMISINIIKLYGYKEYKDKRISLYKPNKNAILRKIRTMKRFPDYKKILYDDYEGILRY